MFLPRFAKDSNIICNADDTWALLENLVYLDLQDVLGHHKSKWHSLEAVTTTWRVEGHEELGGMIKLDEPGSNFGVHLGENR